MESDESARIFKDDGKEPVVEMLFRNGTLTVVGILLSFSLTFVTQWAHNPVPWQLIDLPPLILLCVGILLQFTSVVQLLRHDSLRRRVYDRANRWFVFGIASTIAGVLLAIVIDFFELIAQ